MNAPAASTSSAMRTVVLIVVVAVATFLVMLLLGNIAQRKQEARQHVFRVVELDETTVDPAEWGKNYPRQYDSYLRTVDMERTKHGGSEAFDRLEEYPKWPEIFAGYAFSVDFREDRGHAYMLIDQLETERVHIVQQPGSCIHCHSSNIIAYRKVGLEHGAPGAATDPLLSDTGRAQLRKGFEVMCSMTFEDAVAKVSHPVSCIDCHDPDTMQLRVTRPAFFEGLANFARSDDPAPHLPSIERWRKGDRGKDYDPNVLASRQEMRSLVCGQCHVEYYFRPGDNLLIYPWHKGLKADQMEAYYDEIGFADWTHKISGAKVLKAQHPEFEMWSQGIHARSGVSCSDCHMPYQREGAIKVSNHHVRSPLLNIAQACQVCHNYPEHEILARAEAIQDKTRALMARSEAAVVELIRSIEAAMKAGATDEQLREARAMQRKAQWRLDFVFAENSLGFHASQEAARLLGESIDYARRGEIALLRTLSRAE
jgi:nitrite reductase (cytochrome c-552)